MSHWIQPCYSGINESFHAGSRFAVHRCRPVERFIASFGRSLEVRLPNPQALFYACNVGIWLLSRRLWAMTSTAWITTIPAFRAGRKHIGR